MRDSNVGNRIGRGQQAFEDAYSLPSPEADGPPLALRPLSPPLRGLRRRAWCVLVVDGWVLTRRGHPGEASAGRGTAVGDVWGTGQSVCRANVSGDVPWATRRSVCRPDTSESDPWATQVVVGDSNASVDAPWATQRSVGGRWNICRRAVGNPAGCMRGEDSCVRAVDRGGDVSKPDTRRDVRRVDTRDE